MKVDQYISQLDSKRFGFNIAKLNFFSTDIKSLLSELRELDVKMIISRIDAMNLTVLNNLERNGFLIKDVQLIYNLKLSDYIIPRNDNRGDFILRDYCDKDLSQMVEVTKNSFDNYGHYFNDELLDRDKCLEVYSDWITNCCIDSNFADKIIVAEKDNKIAGYLVFKHYLNENYSFAMLGAVNPEFRKLGVFKAINLEGIKFAKENGIQNVRTNVLNTNYQVNGTYIDLGFKLIKSEITMHCWI